jgi:hypothetical protein
MPAKQTLTFEVAVASRHDRAGPTLPPNPHCTLTDEWLGVRAARSARSGGVMNLVEAHHFSLSLESSQPPIWRTNVDDCWPDRTLSRRPARRSTRHSDFQ